MLVLVVQRTSKIVWAFICKVPWVEKKAKKAGWRTGKEKSHMATSGWEILARRQTSK